jgi:hypothetical protein
MPRAQHTVGGPVTNVGAAASGGNEKKLPECPLYDDRSGAIDTQNGRSTVRIADVQPLSMRRTPEERVVANCSFNSPLILPSERFTHVKNSGALNPGLGRFSKHATTYRRDFYLPGYAKNVGLDNVDETLKKSCREGLRPDLPIPSAEYRRGLVCGAIGSGSPM